jgi:hypothetical protein
LPSEKRSSLKPIPDEVRRALVMGDFQEPKGLVVVISQNRTAQWRELTVNLNSKESGGVRPQEYALEVASTFQVP